MLYIPPGRSLCARDSLHAPDVLFMRPARSICARMWIECFKPRLSDRWTEGHQRRDTVNTRVSIIQCPDTHCAWPFHCFPFHQIPPTTQSSLSRVCLLFLSPTRKRAGSFSSLTDRYALYMHRGCYICAGTHPAPRGLSWSMNNLHS